MWIISALINKILVFVFNKKKKGRHLFRYTRDALMIEEGHIPHMAFRILEGSVVVFLKNSLIGEFGANTSWGTREIQQSNVSNYTVFIRKGSMVCAIGKSELQTSLMKILFYFERDMLAKTY